MQMKTIKNSYKLRNAANEAVPDHWGKQSSTHMVPDHRRYYV